MSHLALQHVKETFPDIYSYHSLQSIPNFRKLVLIFLIYFIKSGIECFKYLKTNKQTNKQKNNLQKKTVIAIYKEFLGTYIKSQKKHVYIIYQLVKFFKLAVFWHLTLQHLKEAFPDMCSSHSLQSIPKLFNLWRPHLYCLSPCAIFQILPNPAYSFCCLAFSLGTLALAIPFCVFYASRHLIYCRFDTDKITVTHRHKTNMPSYLTVTSNGLFLFKYSRREVSISLSFK